MLKKRKYILLLFLIIILFSSVVLAYRPGPIYSCGRYQLDLERIICSYFEKETAKMKDYFPGKEFESFYNKLLEKKYFDKPIKYKSQQCSYGITIISDEAIIYCKYHGNPVNTNKFETMSARKYYSHMHDYGFLVMMGCGILAIAISSLKTLIKKARNK